jgi:hypothetical protein
MLVVVSYEKVYEGYDLAPEWKRSTSGEKESFLRGTFARA